MLHYSNAKNQSGYILTIVCVLFFLISLQTLIALEMVRVDYRLSSIRHHHDDQSLAAKQILLQQRYLALPCVLVDVDDNAMTQLPYSWWQLHGCNGEEFGFNYYFIIQPLAVDACAQVSKNVGAAYYRLSIWLQSQDSSLERIILQEIRILPYPVKKGCRDQVHPVTIGHQLWVER